MKKSKIEYSPSYCTKSRTQKLRKLLMIHLNDPSRNRVKCLIMNLYETNR